jgi:outer membrane usher protein
VTFEGHAEGGDGLVNGGAGFVLNALDRGIVQGAVAGSHYCGGSGFQLALAATTAIGGIVIDAATQRAFQNYADLAMITTPPNSLTSTPALLRIGLIQSQAAPYLLTTSIAPPKALDRISLTIPQIFRLNLALSASFVNLEQMDGEKSRIASLGISKNFPNGASIFANAYADAVNRKDAGIYAGISVVLGDSTSATASADLRRNGSSFSTEAVRSAGPDPGSYGWRLFDNEGATRGTNAEGVYQSQYGRATINAAQYGSGNSMGGLATADLQGSVSALGGSVKFAPTIVDSVALVDAGAPGVTVLEDNRPIGVTDRSGQLLVASLRGFQDNKLSIDPNTLPINAQTSQTEAIVDPKSHSGLFVDFNVATNAHDAEIILRDAHGVDLPTGARVVGGDGKDLGSVGYDGRVYLTGLSAHNEVHVRADKMACAAAFDYAAPKGGVRPTIGPIICQ